MSELVVHFSQVLAKETTHVVVCQGCREPVAEYRGGGMTEARQIRSKVRRHDEYAAFGGHVFSTYSVRDNIMRKGINLSTNRKI